MSTWSTKFKAIAKNFPPIAMEAADSFPILSKALDDELDKALGDYIARGGARVNKRFVEDLLSDIVARIGNCLTLREKAQDVETKAIEAANSYSVQDTALEASIQIADQLAPFRAIIGNNATGVKTEGDTTKNVGEADAWTKIATHEALVRTAQRTALDVMLAKASTPGNATNYIERFIFLKSLFDMGMKELYGRCVAAQQALKILYGIDVELPAVTKNGYLNMLTLWAQQCSDQLDRDLASRYQATVSFALCAADEAPRAHELLKNSEFKARLAGGVINFTLDPRNFAPYKVKDERLLLRSVRLQVRGPDDARTRFWSASLQAPATDLTDGEELFPCVLSTASSDGGNETIFGVHNIAPLGDWALRLPESAITGDPNSEIANIYLHLKFSYLRA